MTDQLYPIISEWRTPIMEGEGVNIKVSDAKALEQYQIACNTCKQFLSGVLVQQGVYYGTLVEVRRFGKRNTREPYMACTGVCRVKVCEFRRSKNLYGLDFAKVEPYPYHTYEVTQEIADMVARVNQIKNSLIEEDEQRSIMHVPDMTTEDAHLWINRFLKRLLNEDKDAQDAFLASDIVDRLQYTIAALECCQIYNMVDKEFHEKVEDSVQQSQKEYYLREQLRVINEELYGDADDFGELEERIENCQAPQEVVDKLRSELCKMRNMAPASADLFVSRNWVETVTDLPWGVTTQDSLSLEEARQILQEDHYGLEKVKQRILEFLSIHRLVGNKNGNILCLYGPPGVGKTSVAKSIARALHRKYVRISLGGMHDEAEIRGHRRTYIGSMAGKIITGLQKAGSTNPVFLMDEVDKLANDYRGDPASALLEVLDPEQNKAFVDNYVEVPFDLSKVLFITTANDISTIAKPLLDRMELIELTGYTLEEKEHIALEHLLPKQTEAHGMPANLVSFTPQAMRLIIEGYTREAGVRKLEQNIASICRKVAVSFGDEPMTPVVLDEEAVRKHLGLARYEHLFYKREDAVGCIAGLAWTEMGGETLDIEAVLMPTKGGLKLTGNLGKVMRESAVTAYNYVKANATRFGLDLELFDRELHIHAPEGAVPKDGPSAGCALVCVILSALSGRKVRADRALTGEVSLTGRVMAIGGLKEKSLGALREGIHTIVVPEENRRDVEELPGSIKEKINYIYTTNVGQVIGEMLR